MQEAECGFVLGCELLPVGASGFEELEGTDDVGLDELSGTVDGAVDVGFGCEVDDGGGVMCGEELVEEGAISDAAVEEKVIRISFEGGKVFGVSGVSEGIEVEHFAESASYPVEDEVGADETGAAGDEEGLVAHGEGAEGREGGWVGSTGWNLTRMPLPERMVTRPTGSGVWEVSGRML